MYGFGGDGSWFTVHGTWYMGYGVRYKQHRHEMNTPEGGAEGPAGSSISVCGEDAFGVDFLEVKRGEA